VRTTLAHEAGHGLLHAYLFATGKNSQPALFDAEHSEEPLILCRDVNGVEKEENNKTYSGRWWEFQANKVMGMLLLPPELVRQSMEPYMDDPGLLGTARIREGSRVDAVRALSDIFDVNRIVVEYRLKELYPEASSGQMSF
jgi:Zn-dependent peptidase ImmA (M78 family)